MAPVDGVAHAAPTLPYDAVVARPPVGDDDVDVVEVCIAERLVVAGFAGIDDGDDPPGCFDNGRWKTSGSYPACLSFPSKRRASRLGVVQCCGPSLST